jgi:hypothetical protein
LFQITIIYKGTQVTTSIWNKWYIHYCQLSCLPESNKPVALVNIRYINRLGHFQPTFWLYISWMCTHIVVGRMPAPGNAEPICKRHSKDISSLVISIWLLWLKTHHTFV